MNKEMILFFIIQSICEADFVLLLTKVEDVVKMGCCLLSEIDDFIVRWTKWGLYSLGCPFVLVLKKVLLCFPHF